jgi:hypothetical protein
VLEVKVNMTNIYQTPESDLGVKDEPLGPLPNVAWYVFFLYILEGTITWVGNYISHGGEEGIELLSFESGLITLIGISIVVYVGYLLKKGKRALHSVNYILLAVCTLPVFYMWFEEGFDVDVSNGLSLASGTILLIIIYLSKRDALRQWLVRN